MLIEEHLEALKTIIPDGVSIDPKDLKSHTGQLYHLDKFPPDLICFPSSENQVIKIVDYCIKHRIPLIPYGSGTSVEGHTAAIHGGICLDMSRMQRILELDQKNGYVTVEPGISYNDLNKELARYDFHFPVEAGWGASIGGMVATNASGPGATDAGSMAKNVASCEVVVCKNKFAVKVTAGTKALKSSAGYNILNLFIGSEGTLGVITKVVLKIRKNFPCSQTLCCQFDNFDEAINFVLEMKPKVHFRKIELLDALQTKACVEYSKVGYLSNNKLTIIMEFCGTDQSVKEDVTLVCQYLLSHGAINLKHYTSREEADEIWIMRKQAGIAAIKIIDQSKKAMVTDTCVPLSNLSECLRSCYAQMGKLKTKAPMVAHIGDGNFHFTVLFNPDNPEDVQAAREFNDLVVSEAIKFGGTCTGEHGVGIGKMDSLKKQHGDLLFIMRNIKRAFDPFGIFNPGKIISTQKKMYCEFGHSPQQLTHFNQGQSAVLAVPSPGLTSKI